MLKVFTGRTANTNAPTKHLILGATAVFQAFEKSKGAPVDIVAVRKASSLEFGQFMDVKKALVAAKLLVDIDGENLGLYTPRQLHTYLSIKDRPVVKDALANAKKWW
jgi:hypothetical protein